VAAVNTFLFAAVIGAAILLCALTVEQLRLRRHRGVSRAEFVRSFDVAGIPEVIPGTVYDYYKSAAISSTFGISPDDTYEEALRKGDEEIDSDARFLLKQLGLKMPPEEILVQWDSRIRTVRDMVLWLNWVRTHQPGKLRV
jgi:hypothetical protein